jgi:hypothetical protein
MMDCFSKVDRVGETEFGIVFASLKLIEVVLVMIEEPETDFRRFC